MATDPSPFTTELGMRLRAARKARGWSLEKTARRCWVSWSYIAQIERGEVNTTVIVLARITRALDVDLGDIMRDLPAPPPGKDPYADDG